MAAWGESGRAFSYGIIRANEGTDSSNSSKWHILRVVCDFLKQFENHTCQLSRFCRESPSFLSNLPVSRLDHQISRLKATEAFFFIKVVACVAGVIVGSRLVTFWATAKPRGEWGGGHKGIKQ